MFLFRYGRILLEKLATAGVYRRYGKKNKIVATRIEEELKVIFDLGSPVIF